METIALGTQGLTVSRQGLGCMGMSDFYGPGDDAESIATIHRALDLGVTFFDTSDMYGPHTNEVLVGKALGRAPRRGGHRHQVRHRARPRRPDQARRQRPARVRAPGLRRLARRGSASTTSTSTTSTGSTPTRPIEETVGRHGRAGRPQGKVRYLGLSEAAPDTIRRAHAVHPISALQTEYSVWSRDPEDEILPTLRELGIGFVPYSPLGRGFLTGALRSLDDLDESDFRRYQPRFQGDNLADNVAIVEVDRPARRGQGLHAGPDRPRLRARGRARRRSRSRAPSAAPTWRRTWPRSTSSSPRRTWPSSTPWRPAQGDRYADMSPVNR